MDREAWLAWYAQRGLATIPLVPRGKRPLRAGWQSAAAAAWDDASPDANIGILCGEASGGLVVLDFDTKEGLRDACGMRPEELAVHTLVVRTARGWHVYAREPGARTRSAWEGLDMRGAGSLVVAPPSTHPSGVAYEFVQAGAPIARLGELPFQLEPDVTEDEGVIEIDWQELDALIGHQAPKLQEHWRRLRAPQDEFDRSRADFAVARCLWEAGYPAEAVASVLMALPGSKAHERGVQYALRTATRAGQARRS